MTFSFHRGSLALDLAGTVRARRSPAPEERLPGPDDLGRWLAEAGLVEGTTPTAGDLDEARALREAIWAAASDVLDGRPVRRSALGLINRAALNVKLGAPQLTPALGARWEAERPVALALGRVAADAVEVLSRQRDRLARCELDGCGALLLSRSRGEPRRWCSMETCGNRAKVAAFRQRRRRR